MDYVSLIAGILNEVLGIATSATSGQTQNILNILKEAVPVAVQTEQALLGPIQNIIAALQGNGQITPEQVAELQAQSDAVDAALDAAAKDAGLSGV